MDVSQLPLIGGLSGLAVFVAVIVYLLNANRSDRAQYRQALSTQAAEHAADRKAWKDERAAERKVYDDRIEELEQRVDVLQGRVDAEQELRRAAQNDASVATRAASAAVLLAETAAAAAVKLAEQTAASAAAAAARSDAALQKIIETRGPP